MLKETKVTDLKCVLHVASNRLPIVLAKVLAPVDTPHDTVRLYSRVLAVCDTTTSAPTEEPLSLRA